MTIRHLAYRLAHDFSGGIAGLAALMGKGAQVLTNKLNPNSTSHYLTIGELETLADFTGGNVALAQYFAAKANAVVITLPEMPESDMGMLDLFLSANKEFGDISAAFQQAFADGRIDRREFEDICKEFDESLARLLELKSGIERIVK